MSLTTTPDSQRRQSKLPKIIADELTADGYEVLLAHNRRHALHLLSSHHPQLVLADINGETLGLLDAVRGGEGLAGEIDPTTPMIVLTARTDVLARVRVFDRGGDDVVAKPFSYPELRGRIRALLRRAYESHPAPVTRIGALSIDHRAREAHVAGRPVKLAAKEFDLLRCLASEPTRVFTKQELLRDVWHYEAGSRSRTLDSHAVRLRQKLAAAGAGRRLVINVWSIGYRLVDGEPNQSEGASR
ncbi:MAG: response regulator transcription factor [Solirubrobacteraceae bacterium]